MMKWKQIIKKQIIIIKPKWFIYFVKNKIKKAGFFVKFDYMNAV